MIEQMVSLYRILGIIVAEVRAWSKAEDTHQHRFVALKFLPDGVARDPLTLTRFQREAQAGRPSTIRTSARFTGSASMPAGVREALGPGCM